MKLTLGLLAASLTITSSGFASDIFVREARGQLTRRQVTEVTSLVRDAVRKMPEHTLVRRDRDADFILQPSVIQRGDELVLRVEKQKRGEILSMSEETINSVSSSRDRALAVTETALQDSSYGTIANASDDNGTASATTSSVDDSASNLEPSSGPLNVGRTQTVRTQTQSNTSTYQTTSPDSTARSGGADASVGELTAASPRMMNPDRAGQIQLGVGPSFAINMKEDSLMYDLIAAYALDFNDNFVGKIFGDFNLGTGSSTTRFINLGVAGEYFPTRELLTFGKPYLGADLGFAFARDALGRTGDNLAGGLAAGFKFQAADINWDVNAHYDLLLAQVADETPSVFGIRVALGF